MKKSAGPAREILGFESHRSRGYYMPRVLGPTVRAELLSGLRQRNRPMAQLGITIDEYRILKLFDRLEGVNDAWSRGTRGDLGE